MPFSKAYLEAYLGLPEKLEEQYRHLNFKNHCYLRMALDHLFGTQWDLKIKRPAHLHLNAEQREAVVKVLRAYLTEPELIQKHHQQSLIFRKECQKKQLKLSL